MFRGRILVLALKKDSLCNKTVPVVRGEKSVILTRNKRFTDLFWLRIVRSISKFFRISHPNLREDRLFISRHHNFSGFHIQFGSKVYFGSQPSCPNIYRFFTPGAKLYKCTHIFMPYL